LSTNSVVDFSHTSSRQTDGVELCETVKPDGDDEVSEVQFCATSEEMFTILLKTEAGPFIYLDVNGNQL
jgi:hypothetical protein